MANNYQSKYQTSNVAQSYKFNEKYEDSEEIEDDEISQHEMKAKDMQNRAGKQKYNNLAFNNSQQFDYQQGQSNVMGVNTYPQKDGYIANQNYTTSVVGLQASQNFMQQDRNRMNNETPIKGLQLNEIPLQQSSSEKPTAVCLVQFHSDSNRMELGSRAIEILCKYSENKISFISIAGLYRSGKSALLNKLLDIRQGEGFKVDDSVNACTQGIWMWSNPEYNEREDLYLFFIDTEGLQSVEQTQDHDTKIFTLTMLLSSFFIYNSKGVIDEQSINQLGLVTKLTKNIAINEYGERMDEYMLAQYTPKFLWLLRDFSLDMVDQKGRKISANQYLENCLLEDVMDKLTFDDLRGEFQKQVIALRSLIFQKCAPKLFNGQYMNGRMMCSMIETFVNNINHKDGIPNIYSAWENIVQNECVVGQQNSLELFEREMKQLLGGRETAVDFMELYSSFRIIRDKVLEKYDSIAGIREKNQFYHQYRIELINHMESREQQAFEKNEDIASMQNDELVKNLTEKLRNKIYMEEYTHQNIDQYISEFNEFLKQYDINAVGMKKAEILISHIHQINDSFINLLVNSIKKDYENKKENKLQSEQINQEKEKYYKQQIELLDENINRYEERIKQQEKQKITLEQDKEKQQKKLEETRKEVENLQKTIKMDIPELQQILDERNQHIERLKSEIQQLKKSKKKGCCG